MSRVFVRNLPSKATEAEIESLFSRCGKIEEIVLKTNFAFIQFSSFQASLEAINQFNDYTLYGNRISVEQAKSRTEKLAERINEKCFKCGEMGHWAKDCKSSKRINNSTKNSSTLYSRPEKRRFRHVRKSPKRSFSWSSFESSSHKSRSRSRSRD